MNTFLIKSIAGGGFLICFRPSPSVFTHGFCHFVFFWPASGFLLLSYVLMLQPYSNRGPKKKRGSFQNGASSSSAREQLPSLSTEREQPGPDLETPIQPNIMNILRSILNPFELKMLIFFYLFYFLYFDFPCSLYLLPFSAVYEFHGDRLSKK